MTYESNQTRTVHVNPNKSLIDCFPFPQIRERQKAALQEAQDAIARGIKIIIIEAPTGFGKSPIAIAFARYFGSSYICTGTKDLQAQYQRDFPFLKTGKGRSNFECHELFRILTDPQPGQEFHCGVGPCKLDSNYKCRYKSKIADYYVENPNTDQEVVKFDPFDFEAEKPCDYYHQKWIAFKASHSVFNYDFYLLHALTGRSVERKKILILDEAHTLEDELTEFQGYTLSQQKLKKFASNEEAVVIPDFEYDMDRWIEFLSKCMDELADFINEAEEKKGTSRRFSEENITAANEEYEKMKAVYQSLQEERQNWVLTNFKEDPKNQRGMNGKRLLQSVQFKPLDVTRLARAVFNTCDNVLMMSATILGKEEFCKTLGLKPEEVHFIQADSDFPVENRPIYTLNIGQLNARTFNEEMPKFAAAVDRIMSEHPGEKGIIHCSSYRQCKVIESSISNHNRQRLLITGPMVNREQLLKDHAAATRPTVLMSPSLHTGVDLKDDLCRFQIIVKVPYPDLTDKLVEKRKERNPNWYNWRTCLQLVQAYGRGIRSKDDHAVTYVLDSNFSGYFMHCSKALLPGWFKAAIQKPSPELYTKLVR